MTNPDLELLFEQFNASGTYLDGYKTGTGHIHTTYAVMTAEETKPDYIIQKINDKVFPHVTEMMDNILKITRHLKRKTRKNSNIQILEIIQTKSRKNFFTGIDGTHWRMYRKISPGISYDIVPNEKVASEAGKAFGQFIADLGDLSAEEIFPVIPGFHSMEMRYENFSKAVNHNPFNRVGEVIKEIDFAENHIERMMIIPRLEKEGKLPLRITHNDTKLNNILFDKNDSAVCVIDLDTVMPGLILYDFGDTIRTAANTGKEDEAELDRVQLNTEVFKAFSEGFLNKTFRFINKYETEHLTLSSQYMTFIMGLRFLTDYISGDVYYTTHYKKQNLRRCRAQFRLMQCMIDSYCENQDFIMQLAKNTGRI